MMEMSYSSAVAEWDPDHPACVPPANSPLNSRKQQEQTDVVQLKAALIVTFMLLLPSTRELLSTSIPA